MGSGAGAGRLFCALIGRVAVCCMLGVVQTQTEFVARSDRMDRAQINVLRALPSLTDPEAGGLIVSAGAGPNGTAFGDLASRSLDRACRRRL